MNLKEYKRMLSHMELTNTERESLLNAFQQGATEISHKIIAYLHDSATTNTSNSYYDTKICKDIFKELLNNFFEK